MQKKTTMDAKEIAKFNEHASLWWDKEGPFKTLHDINPTRLAFILAHAPLEKAKLLDLGCGGGVLSEGLAHLGAKVTGLDLAKDAIAIAKMHALEAQLNIHYVDTPVETYQGGPFDVVTCMEMLEHVPDPALVIFHAARLLKPGGILFLSTINRTFKAYMSLVIGAEYVLGLLPKQTHDYDKFIKPSELAAMVRDAGLEPVNITGMAYHPFTRKASLQSSVAVNYMMVCTKP